MLCCRAEAINTGPLEATIHNLGKEIDFKTKEGQELQRRWINKQTELVALQVRTQCLYTRSWREGGVWCLGFLTHHCQWCWFLMLSGRTHPDACVPHCVRCCLQVENNALAEGLTRQKAELTVLTQKRSRVEQALEAQVKESKALKVAAQRLQVRRQMGH